MREKLLHRGPDGKGSFAAGAVAIAHSRLAVIDPEGGAQPFFNESRSVGVVYNGAIYNFRQLRGELQSLGHTFRTASDTEVIAHAWQQWGEAAVTRFRGMFAFCLIDLRRKLAFLARDHFGIKPLVYSFETGQFLFASEIGAVRAGRNGADELDLDALDEYLHLGYISAPRSVFRGIQKLPAAHTLTVHFDGSTEGPKRYWRFEPAVERGRSFADWTEELEAILRDSVRAHMVADVPIGAFLSGGIDSSLVVSLLAQEAGAQIKTYSVEFANDLNSEAPFARLVSRRWETEHREMAIDQSSLEVLPEMLRRFGEPFADWAAVPLYNLARRAQGESVVCLTGDGGDELFGGYNSYAHWLRDIQRGLGSVQRWKERLIQVMPAHATSGLWRRELRSHLSGRVRALETAFEDSAEFPPLEQAMDLDRQTYLPSRLLNKTDIATMMCGIEARTPMLDLRVAECAARMPSSYKLRLGTRLYHDHSKRVLKRALSEYFPKSFVRRPKTGFSPPFQTWLTRDRRFRDSITDRLCGKGARIHEYLRPSAISDLVGSVETMTLVEPVWALLCLEIWLQDR